MIEKFFAYFFTKIIPLFFKVIAFPFVRLFHFFISIPYTCIFFVFLSIFLFLLPVLSNKVSFFIEKYSFLIPLWLFGTLFFLVFSMIGILEGFNLAL